MPAEASTAVVLWRKPPEIEEHERKMLEARKAEADARLAIAESRRKHAEMLQTGTDLVLSQLRKYLKLAQSPDFENAIGPIDPATVLKLAEFVSKNYRLDTGQATENIAHAIGPGLDFSKLTQEERDQWRALAMKGQGSGQ
jgi:hypothetical protein